MSSVRGTDVGEQAAEAVAPENELLAVLDPVRFGEVFGRMTVQLGSNPQGVLEAFSRLALRSAAAASATAARLAGAAAAGPLELPKKDRRFSDPAWAQNPFYFLVLQEYLAGSRFPHRSSSGRSCNAEESCILEFAAISKRRVCIGAQVFVGRVSQPCRGVHDRFPIEVP
jgi:hypothetical protein